MRGLFSGMEVIRQRQAALVFWALIVLVVLVIDIYPPMVVPLLIVIALELFAFNQARQSEEVTRSNWLRTASFLSMVAATLFLAPTLIEYALDDQVYACFGGCEGQAEFTEGTDIFGLVLLMGITGVMVAAVALWAWINYLVQMQRKRRPGPSLNSPAPPRS